MVLFHTRLIDRFYRATLLLTGHLYINEQKNQPFQDWALQIIFYITQGPCLVLLRNNDLIQSLLLLRNVRIVHPYSY